MEKLIDTLEAWADDPASFRRDTAAFLSLPQEAIDTLVAAIEAHATFNVPATEIYDFETKYELNGNGRRILAAADLIRSYVMQHGREERDKCMAELAESVQVDTFAPEHFSGFVSWLPRLDTERLNGAAIQVGPNLVATDMRCDLRVVADLPNKKWSLVPIIVARLTFDENVAGQQAIFVQLNEEAIGDLAIEVERAQATLQEVRKRYSADLLSTKREE